MDSEAKRDNLFFVGATIILTVVVLGLVLFIFYEKGLIFNKNADEKNNVVENNQEDDDIEEDLNEEVEITDINLKNDLSEKIDFITNFNLGQNISQMSNFRNGTVEGLGNVFNNITDEVKLHIVLSYLNGKGQFVPITEEHKTSSVISSFVNNTGVTIKEVAREVVNNKYREYFGSNLFNTSTQIGKDCFMFYYDASISTYFWVSTSCGGATASSVLAYKNNFTTKDNLAYVYVNYGIIDPVDTTSANIYKDLEKTSIYQGNVAFLEANNFRIDASNYQNFSQYKFTFNKDSNNNYYFTKLEKVN